VVWNKIYKYNLGIFQTIELDQFTYKIRALQMIMYICTFDILGSLESEKVFESRRIPNSKLLFESTMEQKLLSGRCGMDIWTYVQLKYCRFNRGSLLIITIFGFHTICKILAFF
jgi:hypothetical protein